MTRGLGNFGLESEGFACLPDVACVPRREADFLVVASDGLWDVLEDEKCCALVREWGRAAASLGKTAEYLARHARALGSCDDIAIVVAYFPSDADFLQQDGMVPGAPAGA
jgi:serine/threonine protein phosphatase PrpC